MIVNNYGEMGRLNGEKAGKLLLQSYIIIIIIICMYVCNKTIYIAAYATSRFEAALQS